LPFSPNSAKTITNNHILLQRILPVIMAGDKFLTSITGNLFGRKDEKK